MQIYSQKRKWKIFLLITAILIGILSAWYTNQLMQKLSEEERKRIELWAEATEEIINASPATEINTVVFNVIQSNETIPIIVVDSEDNIVNYRNLDPVKMENPKYRDKILKKFKNNRHDCFFIKINDSEVNTVYYADSSILENVYFFPYLQLSIIFLFILMAYIIFNISRRSEQNHVWLGMSKETAHQLGTPISSLMAWVEILKTENFNKELTNEVDKDVKRLEKIATRFSKIGSIPSLEPENVVLLINNSVEYLKSRIPKNINIEFINDNKPVILIPLNADLFEWVIENICKNAADAIGDKGEIIIKLTENLKTIHIDISDTGKGIGKSRQKTIFQPGYTTKKRGWGLGLTLVKRIIQQYHKGKVFVKHSELGKGTIFRIILKK